MKTDNPRNRPPGIRLIHASAAKLAMPSLAPLYQVFLDQRAAIEAERRDLRRRQQAIAQEGFDAAVRLLVNTSEAFRAERAPYFQRLKLLKED